MNDARRLDLSALPPEMRSKLEQQMARMSPEMRAHFLQNGLPQLLQRLGAGAGQAAGAARAAAAKLPAAPLQKAGEALLARATRRKARGHYNETVRPGDAPGAGRWIVMLLGMGAILALLWP